MRTGAVIAAAVAFILTGCTLERAAMPPLAGPSEFALSLSMTATPDQILQDGNATSVVEAVARDASGRRCTPRRPRRFRSPLRRSLRRRVRHNHHRRRGLGMRP